MENKPKFKPDANLKLMDQVREVLRYHHYAYRTEQTYCDWILRFRKEFLPIGRVELAGHSSLNAI